MINTVVNVPGGFYGDGFQNALEKTGDFRVINLPKEPAHQVITVCKEANADIVLLGVSVVSGYTLQERTELIRKMRHDFPTCKIVLFVDENVSPEQTDGVKRLRQVRLIDDFLYASVSLEYMVATLETII